MNQLISAMISDMGIEPYCYESNNSYYYRILFSALGQWCLKTASSIEGISKHAQTLLLNGLTEKYLHLFPEIKEKMKQEGQQPISVFIRRIYEETGYLLTDENNHNRITHYDRGVQIGPIKMMFGFCPKSTMNGLGLFSGNTRYIVPWQEVLIRDSLDSEQYLMSKYDLTLFRPTDIEIERLQFFNPQTNFSPSQSWGETMETEKTVARDLSTGAYYRIQQFNGELLFCADTSDGNSDCLIDYEYRRLYFALKKHYQCPLKARIQQLDQSYSLISLGGHLPNREYYMILLCSWPRRMYCDKQEFIIKNCFLGFVSEILMNLGIETIGG